MPENSLQDEPPRCAELVAGCDDEDGTNFGEVIAQLHRHEAAVILAWARETGRLVE